MPIRDVETFFPSVSNSIRFLANRGANGIDGVVSSAAGAALAAGGRAWLLTGELALLHDIGGLLAAHARARSSRSSARTTAAARSSTSSRLQSTVPARPSSTT